MNTSNKYSFSINLTPLLLLLFFSCTGLDDQSLPPEAVAKIKFQSFEIDPARNYFIAHILNESSYTLSSCRLKISLYKHEAFPPNGFTLTEADPSEIQIAGEQAFMVEEFHVRSPIAPGYSTEVYYELNLDQLRGKAVFTKEIVDLKGRSVTP